MSKTIRLDAWTTGINRRLTRKDKLWFWWQRRGIYQRYVWRRYGKRIVITGFIKLAQDPKKVNGHIDV